MKVKNFVNSIEKIIKKYSSLKKCKKSKYSDYFECEIDKFKYYNNLIELLTEFLHINNLLNEKILDRINKLKIQKNIKIYILNFLMKAKKNNY
jgi:hypothetical protein